MKLPIFFDHLREIAGGTLKQGQVSGTTDILKALVDHQVPLNSAAYVLATAWHETDQTMQPVEENLNYSAKGLLKTFPKYFSAANAAKYARKPEAIANRAYGGRMSNGPEASGDGWKWRGRGYAQITGKDNYQKFSLILGLDLLGDPDLALTSDIAAKILVYGMIKGTFTSRKLADFCGKNPPDYVNARQIINGMDKDDLVAGYARQFQTALMASGYDGRTL